MMEESLCKAKGKIYVYSPSIRDNIGNLQLKIEKRQMTAEEYCELLAKSSEWILDEWADEAEKRIEAIWMIS
jgi:siroheme synthase (precorrin-2 oxidase/ferrochelatase)